MAIKREGTLSFSEIFVPDILGEYALQFPENEFSMKICQRSNFLICKSAGAKLECADIDYVRAMKGRSTSSIKMKKKKKSVYTKGSVWKDTRKHELQKKFLKISKTEIAETYLSKLTSYLRDFKNPYLEDDLANLHV